MADVQQIVTRIESGEATAEEELLPLVYDELRALASSRLAKDAQHSLQTTDLVHEAYLRLVGSNTQWEGRAHFFGAAAEAMRRVLVDRARRKQRIRHGGGRRRVELHDSAMEAGSSPDEILIVNELFDRLAEKHPTEAELAKLRYFVGFTLAEAAAALNISVGSAHKYWKFARAWLYREYSKE
ncbi:MAG: sigma-70 family RNA polymerase sigma factor [Planctomycetes bacterium]|nr:sigma-70 family RNA polymerase sigma factor [Planctomycetota bacterium]